MSFSCREAIVGRSFIRNECRWANKQEKVGTYERCNAYRVPRLNSQPKATDSPDKEMPMRAFHGESVFFFLGPSLLMSNDGRKKKRLRLQAYAMSVTAFSFSIFPFPRPIFVSLCRGKEKEKEEFVAECQSFKD